MHMLGAYAIVYLILQKVYFLSYNSNPGGLYIQWSYNTGFIVNRNVVSFSYEQIASHESKRHNSIHQMKPVCQFNPESYLYLRSFQHFASYFFILCLFVICFSIIKLLHKLFCDFKWIPKTEKQLKNLKAILFKQFPQK